MLDPHSRTGEGNAFRLQLLGDVLEDLGSDFGAVANILDAVATLHEEAGSHVAALVVPEGTDHDLGCAGKHTVGRLNGAAGDLTRLLEAEVPDADWKRYTNGDRTIFTRNLLKGKQASIVGRITEKLKNDDKMRQYVTRFVDEFDRLVRESEAVDPENLLHSTFMTADVGRLFLLLSRALGRDGLQD